MSMPPSAALRRFQFKPGIALGVLLAVAVAMVAVARITAPPAATGATAEAAMQIRLLRFDDLPDGAVGVVDMADGRAIARFEGEQGFLRGTLRAMARERRMKNIAAQLPFELIAYADGRLTLHDPATGMRIALESFGSTNAGVFARLLR